MYFSEARPRHVGSNGGVEIKGKKRKGRGRQREEKEKRGRRFAYVHE